jgi:hypothetical protein
MRFFTPQKIKKWGDAIIKKLMQNVLFTSLSLLYSETICLIIWEFDVRRQIVARRTVLQQVSKFAGLTARHSCAKAAAGPHTSA